MKLEFIAGNVVDTYGVGSGTDTTGALVIYSNEAVTVCGCAPVHTHLSNRHWSQRNLFGVDSGGETFRGRGKASPVDSPADVESRAIIAQRWVPIKAMIR